MYVLWIVVCPFVLFLLAIVLSVLRYTDSDYPFGIFKLFFWLFCIEYLFQENMQISEAYSGIKRFFFYKKHSLLKTQISDQIFNYLIKCNKLFCREHFPFVEVKVYV